MATATRKRSDDPVETALRFVFAKAERTGVYAPRDEVEEIVRDLMSGHATSVPDRARFVLEWLEEYGFRGK